MIGITASRLGERYHKPVILLSVGDDGIARGSARSVEGVHITEAIAAQKDILHGFGGHPMAAGMALDADQIQTFRRRISKTITEQLGTTKVPKATLVIDAWLPLIDLSLTLSAELTKLSPFGPHNPSLTLASRDLTLVNVAEIGKNKEHLRLTIKDRDENHQSVLWWNAAEEDLPPEGSRFDLAFKMRTGEYRGAPQLTLEFVDFRVTEEVAKKAESRKKVEVVDLRLKSEGWKVESGDTQVFVEGRSDVEGLNRYQLSKSDDLVLYSSPPGTKELHAILKKVEPKKICLVGVNPPEFTPQEFLTHLAGLVKYTLAKKDGKTEISTLAAVTAQREATIRLGLEWLAAGGQVVVDVEEDDVMLSPQTTKVSETFVVSDSGKYAQADLFLAVKGLLEETIAFRKHFHVGDAEKLISR